MNANKPGNPKSKRAQLQAKKKQKAGKAASRIVDLDEVNLISDEANKVEVVESEDSEEPLVPLDPLPQNLGPQTHNKFNTFNYSRLTKLASSSIQVDPSYKKPLMPEIEIVSDHCPLNSSSEQAYRSYTFSIEGQKDQMKVREAFLKDLASKQPSYVPRPPITEQVEKKVLAEVRERVAEQFEKKSRYFEISHELCFKCNKQGHYAKNCIELDSRKCKICFSRQHDQHSCPQICYECGEAGHISNQCPYSRNERCERCRQRGHSSNFCGVITKDKEKIVNLEQFFCESDLKKMKCITEEEHKSAKKDPHFNCFVYKDWPMPYHELRKQHSHNRNPTPSRNPYPPRSNPPRLEEPRNVYKIDQQGYLIARTNYFESRNAERREALSYNTMQNPRPYYPMQQSYPVSYPARVHQHSSYQRTHQHPFSNRHTQQANGNRYNQQSGSNRYNQPNSSRNGANRWNNDEFERYSRNLEERERGGRGRQKKGRQFKSETYY